MHAKMHAAFLVGLLRAKPPATSLFFNISASTQLGFEKLKLKSLNRRLDEFDEKTPIGHWAAFLVSFCPSALIVRFHLEQSYYFRHPVSYEMRVLQKDTAHERDNFCFSSKCTIPVLSLPEIGICGSGDGSNLLYSSKRNNLFWMIFGSMAILKRLYENFALSISLPGLLLRTTTSICRW